MIGFIRDEACFDDTFNSISKEVQTRVGPMCVNKTPEPGRCDVFVETYDIDTRMTARESIPACPGATPCWTIVPSTTCKSPGYELVIERGAWQLPNGGKIGVCCG